MSYFSRKSGTATPWWRVTAALRSLARGAWAASGHRAMELREMSRAEQRAAILTNGRACFWEQSRY